MRHFTARLSHLRQQQQQQASASTVAAVTADTAAASTAATSSSNNSSTDASRSPADPATDNNTTDQQPETAPDASQEQQQQQQPPGQLDVCLPEQVAAEDDDEDQPVLPITRVAYQQGSSDECCMWLGGPAAGQVSHTVTVTVALRFLQHTCTALSRVCATHCMLVAALQVLVCSWATQPPSPVGSSIAVVGATVSVTSSSWSGAYRLVGTADGQVRVEEAGPAPR
jgi:hypothetical protein